MALVGIKTLLRAGVEGGGGKIEKVEGEVNSLAELTGGKLENESARIAKVFSYFPPSFFLSLSNHLKF